MEAKKQLDKWYDAAEQVSPVRVRTLSRGSLMKLFNKFGFKNGAEIGVDRGTFSRVMLQSITDLKLYCVDPWLSRDGESRYRKTMERLREFENQITIIKKISMEALKDIEDGSLDFVYIDGDHHFDYAMTDIIEWAKKVKVGGIIAGHDYYRFRQAGVIEAVDVYTKMHKIDKWFLTDYLKDRTPSFFWVKEEEPWNKK